MKPIKGRIVLLTGASAGIGKAIALNLAKEGAKLFMIGTNRQRLDALLEQPGMEESRIFRQDLTESGAAQRVVDHCVQAMGGIDVIINNAGIGQAAPIEETTEALFDNIMSLNVKAPYFLIQAALPYLEASQCPSVINISSIVGLKGYENQSAYTASKHALTGMSKALRRELFDKDIRIHTIYPGGVDTEMIRSCRTDLNPEILSRPEEIAELVAFLLRYRGHSVVDDIVVRRYTKMPD